jgi:chromosome segregation ATPase
MQPHESTASGPTPAAQQSQIRDQGLPRGSGHCSDCDIRARQVDEMSVSLSRLEIRDLQREMSLHQMESAWNYHVTCIKYVFQQLVAHQKQENSVLKERINQLQLAFNDQALELYELQQDNRVLQETIDQSRLLFEDQVPTQERDKEVETNTVLHQEITRLRDEVTRLTTEMKEKKGEQDRVMANNAMLKQEVNELKDQLVRSTEDIQREKETKTVLSQEVTGLQENKTAQSSDRIATLTADKHEFMLKVRDLSAKNESNDRAVTSLTRQVHELTQANEELLRDRQKQENRLAVLESQKDEWESVVTSMPLNEMIKKEKIERQVEEFETKETEGTKKQQAEEELHQLKIELKRAKDKIKSLKAQVSELNEKREEDKKRFESEVSLESKVSEALRKEKAELVKQLQIKKQKEGERKDEAEATAQRRTTLTDQNERVEADSGVNQSH